MEKYRRVIDPDKQNALFPDDPWVLRINVSGKLANLIAYAERRLFDDELGKVELVALGRAINRAVTVAEILRRNHPTVHQLTTLRSVSMRNKFVPLEEGLRVSFSNVHVRCHTFRLADTDCSCVFRYAGARARPDEFVHLDRHREGCGRPRHGGGRLRSAGPFVEPGADFGRNYRGDGP